MHDFIRSHFEKRRVRTAYILNMFHMSLMVFIGMNATFRCQNMEGCKFIIIYACNFPAIGTMQLKIFKGRNFGKQYQLYTKAKRHSIDGILPLSDIRSMQCVMRICSRKNLNATRHFGIHYYIIILTLHGRRVFRHKEDSWPILTTIRVYGLTNKSAYGKSG